MKAGIGPREQREIRLYSLFRLRHSIEFEKPTFSIRQWSSQRFGALLTSRLYSWGLLRGPLGGFRGFLGTPGGPLIILKMILKAPYGTRITPNQPPKSPKEPSGALFEKKMAPRSHQAPFRDVFVPISLRF